MPPQKQTESHIYVFSGKDFSKIQRAISELEKKLFSKKQYPSLEKTKYFADETHFVEIMADLETYPLFSSHKIVQVYRAEKISAAQFQKYLANPGVKSFCILVSEYPIKEWNKALGDLVRVHASISECAKPSQNSLLSQLKQFCRQRNIAYEKEALLFLSESLEHSDLSCAQLLHMIEASWSVEKTLKLADVSQFLSGVLEYSVFEWLDSLFEKRVGRALFLFAQSVANEQFQAASLIRLLYRQLSLLCAYFFALKARVPELRMAAELGVAPFIVKKLRAHAACWSSVYEVLPQFSHLAQLESYARSVPQVLLPVCFELFIVQFCCHASP